MIISWGSEVYGKVKVVDGTPIVTRFFMVCYLPLFPIESHYFLDKEYVEQDFVETQFVIRGLQLRSVDKTSVLVGYLRALFAILILAGIIMSLMSGISKFSDIQPPAHTDIVFNTSIVAVLAAGLGGALTYLLLRTSRRERLVRSFCRELLGLAADPARVADEINTNILETIAFDSNQRRIKLLQELIATRVTLAQGADRKSLEMRTDELLGQLEREPPLAEADLPFETPAG